MLTEQDMEDVNRIFTKHMKTACWNKAPPVPGRDPTRWRLDPSGNIVSALLRGCMGCLCHEYDHIQPFSKGGPTTIENCQILQTRVNRMKGNDDDDPEMQRKYSCAKRWTEQELDVIEMALYGDVSRPELQCRCKSVGEFESRLPFRLPKRAVNVPGCPYQNIAEAGNAERDLSKSGS